MGTAGGESLGWCEGSSSAPPLPSQCLEHPALPHPGGACGLLDDPRHPHGPVGNESSSQRHGIGLSDGCLRRWHPWGRAARGEVLDPLRCLCASLRAGAGTGSPSGPTSPPHWVRLCPRTAGPCPLHSHFRGVGSPLPGRGFTKQCSQLFKNHDSIWPQGTPPHPPPSTSLWPVGMAPWYWAWTQMRRSE